MNVMVLFGTARPNSQGKVVGEWVSRELKKREGVTIDFVNAADLELPFYDEASSPMGLAQYSNPKGTEWAARVDKADAFIFVTAEYNHGYTAAMKNAIDWVGKEWAYKPVSFVSYGADAGGARAVEQLKQVVLQLRMIPINDPVKNVVFNHVYAGAFDESGEPTDASKTENLSTIFDLLIDMTNRLSASA